MSVGIANVEYDARRQRMLGDQIIRGAASASDSIDRVVTGIVGGIRQFTTSKVLMFFNGSSAANPARSRGNSGR